MDMRKLMQQAQQMQKQMAKQQEVLAQKIFEASSGGGMVTARVNGRNDLLEIKIDPEVVNKDDVALLQDMVVAAVNEAHHRCQEEVQKELQGLMGGLNIPGLT